MKKDRIINKRQYFKQEDCFTINKYKVNLLDIFKKLINFEDKEEII